MKAFSVSYIYIYIYIYMFITIYLFFTVTVYDSVLCVSTYTFRSGSGPGIHGVGVLGLWA